MFNFLQINIGIGGTILILCISGIQLDQDVNGLEDFMIHYKNTWGTSLLHILLFKNCSRYILVVILVIIY